MKVNDLGRGVVFLKNILGGKVFNVKTAIIFFSQWVRRKINTMYENKILIKKMFLPLPWNKSIYLIAFNIIINVLMNKIQVCII